MHKQQHTANERAARAPPNAWACCFQLIATSGHPAAASAVRCPLDPTKAQAAGRPRVQPRDPSRCSSSIARVDAVIWHNPRCSKSRGARELLAERGVDATEVRYLDNAPDRAALEDVLHMLGTDDPLAITRTGEARFRELRLGSADRDTLLDALAAHPELIERPIVVIRGRAVVARPPEKLLKLLEPGP